MPHIFSDSPAKKTVREKWNTPLLKHLHETYGFVYRYFGLPGPDILDVKLWKEMIKEVVAFEVPAPGGIPERKYINDLRRNLEILGLPNIAYYGPFEEIILRRQDHESTQYDQSNVITLYNLDFCEEYNKKVWKK